MSDEAFEACDHHERVPLPAWGEHVYGCPGCEAVMYAQPGKIPSFPAFRYYRDEKVWDVQDHSEVLPPT